MNGLKVGQAFIEFFGDDTKLRGTMKSIAKNAQALSASIAKVGKSLVLAGTAIVAPLLLASTKFAQFGDEVAKMSDRTGLAAKSISTLAFAADRSDVSFSGLKNGIRAMQVNLTDFAEGTGTAKDALDKLGFAANDFAGKDTETQFKMIASAISEIEDPAERATRAADIFGAKVGSELLPLLREGADGISALQKEGEKLGFALTDADAAAGAKLTDAFANVSFALKGITNQLGASLAGPLTNILNLFANGAGIVANFVKDNRGLVQVVAAVGVGLIAAGTALTAVAGVVALAGLAFSGVATIIGGFVSGTIPIAIAAMAGIAFQGTIIVSVWAAVSAAVLKGIQLFVKFTSVGQALAAKFSPLINLFKNVGSTLRESFGDAFDAIANGRLDLAAKIALTGVKLAFFQGIEGIYPLLVKLKNTALNIFDRVGVVLTNMWSKTWEFLTKVVQAGVKFISAQLRPLIAIAKLTVGGIGGALSQLSAFSTGAGFDVSAFDGSSFGNVSEEQQAGIDQRKAARNAETENAGKAIAEAIEREKAALASHQAELEKHQQAVAQDREEAEKRTAAEAAATAAIEAAAAREAQQKPLLEKLDSLFPVEEAKRTLHQDFAAFQNEVRASYDAAADASDGSGDTLRRLLDSRNEILAKAEQRYQDAVKTSVAERQKNADDIDAQFKAAVAPKDDDEFEAIRTTLRERLKDLRERYDGLIDAADPGSEQFELIRRRQGIERQLKDAAAKERDELIASSRKNIAEAQARLASSSRSIDPTFNSAVASITGNNFVGADSPELAEMKKINANLNKLKVAGIPMEDA